MEQQRINLFGQSGDFLSGLLKNEMYIKDSGLDLRLIEMIKFRVSQINGCAYCLDMHFKEATKMGEDPLRLYSLSVWRECPYYSETEQIVLKFTEAIMEGNVCRNLYEHLAGFFSTDKIAALTLAIANINSWNILNKTFCTTPGTYKPTSSSF